ncbi:hypothetical protein CPB85DRAFT_1444952 [Mucidula mucida]|nr:hypothetical protein CPB85DRAFT_1444952 [Mucidula mucida]
MSWADDYDNHPPAATSMSWADEPYTPHTGFSLSQAITVADSNNEENSEGNDVDEDDNVDSILRLLLHLPPLSRLLLQLQTRRLLQAHPTQLLPPPAVEPSFVAGVAYYTVPTEELEPHSDSVCSTRWYVVTRGRFVGVFSEASMADDAVTGVSNHFRQKKNNLLTALDMFNSSLRRGAVAVVNV